MMTRIPLFLNNNNKTSVPFVVVWNSRPVIFWNAITSFVICLLESGSGEIANSSSSSNVVVVPVVADASSGNSAQDE